MIKGMNLARMGEICTRKNQLILAMCKYRNLAYLGALRYNRKQIRQTIHGQPVRAEA